LGRHYSRFWVPLIAGVRRCSGTPEQRSRPTAWRDWNLPLVPQSRPGSGT